MGDWEYLISHIVDGVIVMVVVGFIVTVVGLTILGIVLYKVYKHFKKKKQEEAKAKETERILKTDLNTMVDELADKYNK